MPLHDKWKLPLKTKLYVYVSHFLSAWGDRMWSFGVGLFLIRLNPGSLRLVAIYGFSKGASVLLFAAIIGDWIDNTPRLRAARLSLVLQNILVALCAGIVFVVVWYHETLRTLWPDEGALTLFHALIIVVAILGDLASIARSISVERDWIVEICGRDKDLLATMTSRMRAIDLTTAILSPVATGQIVYFIALQYAAVFIAGWNLVSVFIEYFLIWKVYMEVPALKSKMFKTRKDKVVADEAELLSTDEGIQLDDKSQQEQISQASNIAQEKTEKCIRPSRDEDDTTKEDNSVEKDACNPCLYKMFKSFILLVRGWKTYMKYDVAFAGLGLASLYMTVIGFDSITVGYAYAQGISESLLGVMMAAGSIFGIAGTFAYPRIQKRIGLERTGLFGLGFEIFSLCFCVASVFAPGSPFDLLYRTRENDRSNSIVSSVLGIDNNTINSNLTVTVTLPTSIVSNLTVNETMPTSQESSDPTSYISIGLFLGGLITARFGLWIADLTITQMFLQAVVETERGIISGIQRSLNQLMDMLKFLMVILAPYPQEFGLLVLISFVFVCMGWIFYARYSYSVRGHLFHFDKLCPDKQNNNILPETGNGNKGNEEINNEPIGKNTV
ncbi:solute carrier family 40 member 1-like [Mytilus californianus]|uniref:solute carrier family 40 member 1-like n=1 Tax=Mytilus californianus TaxID=6549 RepID=UPI002248529B|nr:solute carrier family 40 member 1-like [Mytilus californianus]